MKLCSEGLKNRQEWIARGYRLPEFDREAVRAKTEEAPVWLHFGAGNIFRAFQANVVQNLLNEGSMDTGLIAVGRFDDGTMEKMNRSHDGYNVLVTLKADGTVEKTVIGSVEENLMIDADQSKDDARLKEIFRADSLQMVSFTITEKGYSLTDGSGALLPSVKSDMEKGPQQAESYMGRVASLLYERYLSGQKPLAMVSMDNCSHNGDKLHEAIHGFADAWVKNGTAEAGFVKYVDDKAKVSFPWTMIDKITPRPDAKVEEILKKDGLEDIAPVVTSRGTYIAPFVNAEECQYLVIEDAFPNGRPQLERGGVIFTERETVDKVEKMKVCTCLNPLHTSLAVFGCLLGYQLISEEMKNPVLKKLAEGIGYKEGLPVVVNPGILNPKTFIDEVVNLRLPNPFMPDAPQRIATDTSQKLPIRFGETIRAYAASDKLDVADLKLIPLVLAGWVRYLMAVDDSGKPFDLSPDPLLDTVCPHVADIRLGETEGAEEKIRPILENQAIFGADLYGLGIAPRIVSYFKELIAGPGAVQKTLEKYV